MRETLNMAGNRIKWQHAQHLFSLEKKKEESIVITTLLLSTKSYIQMRGMQHQVVYQKKVFFMPNASPTWILDILKKHTVISATFYGARVTNKPVPAIPKSISASQSLPGAAGQHHTAHFFIMLQCFTLK